MITDTFPLGTAVIFGAFVAVVLLMLMEVLRNARDTRKELLDLSNKLHVVARHTSEEITALQTAHDALLSTDAGTAKLRKSRRSTDVKDWVTDSNVLGDSR